MRKSYTLSFKLEVVEYAEKTSGEAAAKRYNVHPKRVFDWKKQKAKLAEEVQSKAGRSRKILGRGGRKIVSEEMENLICDWIIEKRENGERVSIKMICVKAQELHPLVGDSRNENFQASRGWARKFLKRNNLSVRRKTTVAQKDPDQLCEKLVSFVAFVSQLKENHAYQDEDIVAMDETSVWFDMLSNTTVDQVGKKTISVKSTGNEKAHATVVLAAKADGTKLKPYIVFKGCIRKVQAMKNLNGAVVATSKNGWMNLELTKDWINKVYGTFSFKQRLLVWDSYRCHLAKPVKDLLKKSKISTAVIPGGCTKYIQAPDVSWNKPFKENMVAFYDLWMAGDNDKEYTKGGNLKAPSPELITKWVMDSWKLLKPEVIIKSFKVCALTTALDGSEDSEIGCFKNNEPCRSGWELLVNYRDSHRLLGQEIIEIEEIEDDEELENNEVIIAESDDETSDSYEDAFADDSD